MVSRFPTTYIVSSVSLNYTQDGFVLPNLKYNRYLYEILVSKYTVRLYEGEVAQNHLE